MDEIGYINKSVFFINKSGNPHELKSVLDRLYYLISENHMKKESPAFVYYLDRVAEDMIISEHSTGPSPMMILPYKLVGGPENSTDIPDEDYRFYIFYILCRLHQELDDLTE